MSQGDVRMRSGVGGLVGSRHVNQREADGLRAKKTMHVDEEFQ